MYTAAWMTLQQRQSRARTYRDCACGCLFIPAASKHITALIKMVFLHMCWSGISCQVPADGDIYGLSVEEALALVSDRLMSQTLNKWFVDLPLLQLHPQFQVDTIFCIITRMYFCLNSPAGQTTVLKQDALFQNLATVNGVRLYSDH